MTTACVSIGMPCGTGSSGAMTMPARQACGSPSPIPRSFPPRAGWSPCRGGAGAEGQNRTDETAIFSRVHQCGVTFPTHGETRRGARLAVGESCVALGRVASTGSGRLHVQQAQPQPSGSRLEEFVDLHLNVKLHHTRTSGSTTRVAKPIKWRYSDVSRRLRAPHSTVTVHQLLRGASPVPTRRPPRLNFGPSGASLIGQGLPVQGVS